MKKIFPAFFLVMISISATPQQYHKFIRPNTYWDNYVIYYPEICYTSASRIFFTGSDTVLNGHTYTISKEYPFQAVNPGPFCPPFVVDTVSYISLNFLREDTIARKVYIYDPQAYPETDQLLWDFSLQKGDTLKSTYSGGGMLLVVDTIVNVQLLNGSFRKQFCFGGYPTSIFYIESIGGSNGIFIPLWVFEAQGGYFCVKENGQNIFGEDCIYYFVGMDQEKTGKFSVYPNPAHDILNIDFPDIVESSDFTIFNLQGKLLINFKLTSRHQSVSLLSLQPGAYFYKVESSGRKKQGKVFIF